MQLAVRTTDFPCEELNQMWTGPDTRAAGGKIIRFSMRVALGSVLQCRYMNIIIEDAESLKFFISEGLWTTNVTESRRYARTGLAFKAAKQEPVGKFNIVGHIPATGQFVNLNHGRGKGAVEIPA